MRIWIVVFFVATCASAFADQVSLKNGDRLSGTIVKADAKELVLETDFAGTVTIKWESITGVDSSSPLHLELQKRAFRLRPGKVQR
jgi:hypothetical protein